MAFAEWTICQCDDSTEAVPGPLGHMSAFAAVTATHTVISALSIVHQPCHFPAASEICNSLCQLAGGCGEIIIGVAIEVAAKTTDFTLKIF